MRLLITLVTLFVLSSVCLTAQAAPYRTGLRKESRIVAVVVQPVKYGCFLRRLFGRR
jgi:hypothetical protein